MTEFERVRAETLFSGFVFDVERRHLSADGVAFTREIVVHPGAVAIVAVDDQNRVVLLEQYRASIDQRQLEIPAGTCDVFGEELRATAIRELIEETGFEPAVVTELGSFYNSSGYCNQKTVVFLATSLREIGRAPAGPEEIDSTVHLVDLAQAVAMVGSGQILEGTAAFGLLMAGRAYGL